MNASTRWSALQGACAALLMLALAGGAARAEDAKVDAPQLKVSVAVGPAYALGQAAERWARRIGEMSDDRLSATLHPGAVLSARDPGLEFNALREGAADLAVGSTLAWSAQVPELGVVSLPWLAPEPAQLEALAGGAVSEALRAAVMRHGAVALALAPLGYRALATSARPIKAPEDVAGLRVRIVASPELAALYEALKARPMAMAFSQVQAAFAAGTLDAQDGSAASFAGSRLDALGLKWMLQWDAVAEIAVFAVNEAQWNALTERQRAIVRDAAIEAARELPALAKAEDDAAAESLRKGGMTVVRLTSAGRAAFAQAARDAYDKLAAQAGGEITRAAEAAVQASTPR